MTSVPIAEEALISSAQEGPAERGTAQPRRDEILHSAAELFAAHGVNGVSMNQIAAKVGLSAPALYRYFEGKDAILAQVLLRDSRMLLDTARRLVAELEPAKALEALVDFHVRFAITQPDLIVIQWRELANLHGPDRRTVRELQRDYIDVWAANLLRVRPDITLSTAISATVGVFGLINSTPFALRRTTPERLTPTLRELALAALLRSELS